MNESNSCSQSSTKYACGVNAGLAENRLHFGIVGMTTGCYAGTQACHSMHAFIKATAQQIREAHRQLNGPAFLSAYCALVDRMFPGGWAQTFPKIQTGDDRAIEAGLAFVEVRPYFFRSQYIRTKLLRLLKHASLSPLKAERLQQVLARESALKLQRKVPCEFNGLSEAKAGQSLHHGWDYPAARRP